MVLYRFIKYLILNVKYTRLLKKIYEDEHIIEKFSRLFGTEFRMDWVGRLYTIINPNIVDDKLDLNTQFFEYGENGLSNTMYVEKWVMTKLNAIQDFVMANNLFDILTYDIERLDDYDNYLFVIRPITFDDCAKWTKIFFIVYPILGVIATTLLILF